MESTLDLGRKRSIRNPSDREIADELRFPNFDVTWLTLSTPDGYLSAFPVGESFRLEHGPDDASAYYECEADYETARVLFLTFRDGGSVLQAAVDWRRLNTEL